MTFKKGQCGNREGNKNPFYGKKHSEELKLKLSELAKNRCQGNKNPFYGKKHTEEIKEKIRLARLGKSSIKGIPKSEEHKKNLSKSKKRLFEEGKTIPWARGKSFSEVHRNNISKSRKELYTQGKIKVWNKGLIGEEYLKHFKEGKTYWKDRELDFKPWNKNKTHLEDSRILSGEKIHTFNNWSANKPYTKEFNKQFKLYIKQRDGFLCLKCGMREEDSKSLFKSSLHIHHIDYNKHLTLQENCCSLCTRCNSEVNFNRPSWTTFFQSLLKERYGYTYDELGNILITNLNQ